MSGYLLTSTFNNTLANYTTLNVLSSTLSSYHTISAYNSSIAGYQPSITTSTNLSINNLVVGGNVVLPCIIRNNSGLVSIAGNTNTTLLFPTSVAYIGNMGLSYNNSNGFFINTSGANLSCNVSCRVPFAAGGLGYRNVIIQHSNSNYGRLGEITVSNQTTTSVCVINVSANVILVPNDYFYIIVYQTSGGTLNLTNTAGQYTNITIR